MRVAVMHDYFGAIGGGEKLALLLARGLEADLYTTDLNVESLRHMGGCEGVRIYSIGANPRLPPLKQLSASWRFARLDLRCRYDFYVFTGTWSVFAARRHHPNLWYCYTPVRAFYDQLTTFRRQLGPVARPPFDVWSAFHRAWWEMAVRHVDRIAVISENVRKRVKAYLGQDSTLIYPPIDRKKYYFKRFGDFWLSVNRLYPEKRIELQMEAFRMLPSERLVVVGGFAEGDHAAQYARRLVEMRPSNVEFLGEVPEGKLLELYATCRGLVTTAVDEDLGLTPLEAAASGKPVVAVDEGGYRETVVHGVTGMLVKPTPESVARAIKTISRSQGAFTRNTSKYPTEKAFLNGFRELIG